MGGTRRRGVRLGLGCFAIQFVLNLVWTPAFLGLQRPDLDLVVFVALGVAILATIVSFRPVCSLAGWLLVPYLAWVTFAAVSNAVILIG